MSGYVPPTRERLRINVAAFVPESGAANVSANVIAIWDAGTDPKDVEEAIKAAARRAIQRYRDAARDNDRSSPLGRRPAEQLPLPFPAE